MNSCSTPVRSACRRPHSEKTAALSPNEAVTPGRQLASVVSPVGMVRTTRFAQVLPAALLMTVAAAIGGCSGCDEDAVKKPTAASGKLPGGLTPELAR